MSHRFLYADETKKALQVAQPGLGDTLGSAAETTDKGGIVSEVDEGMYWIDADPMPGCVVCNIGESACLLLVVYRELSDPPQCGKFGPTVCTRALCIE